MVMVDCSQNWGEILFLPSPKTLDTITRYNTRDDNSNTYNNINSNITAL
jgi:hypothetical protein